ncbi:HlyD family secretion protein [Sedimentibacter acidaminivorans]|uniref:HlyD family secretion protein n=1 Tax=Sedimentibacter acidaminivorans TaxID=913099 RepID=A0ABS4GFA1_9FIRM|nr:HlyD family efflux transporter periplasmic adaptor subunit [Sedimentibacter acidaminivorans]MBP1926334.1 HlyD family secretion protein [Sedimentibacter acidaminivorans]
MDNGKKSKKWKPKKIKLPKLTKKKIVIIVIIGVVVLGGSIYGYNKLFLGKSIENFNTATVTKGGITVSIEGSGVIEPIEMYEITSLATGEILQSDFEEGQEVKAGDLLYVIDTKDIENTIEKAKVSLEKQQLSHSEILDSYAGLLVASPIPGVITECYVKNGDYVQSGTKIADIINNEYMMLEIPFNSNDASNINVGDTAQVTLENSFYESTGTVQYVSSGEIVIDSGATVSTVKIKVKNPGSITNADKATAIINNMACNSSGTFDYWEQKTVTAQTSGDVISLNHTTGDKVSDGSIIVNLESKSAEISLKQSELSLKDSELALQNTYDQLDDYNITSPISGTVVQKNSKAGDTLDTNTKSTTMAVIADMSKLTFELDVDELDIGKIAVGQKVTVTADSLSGKSFEGTIENISAIGTSTDGVASYPVTVEMDNTGDLMIGMNVNAEIVIESKQDILRIPSSALNRNNRVLVEDKDGSKAAAQAAAQAQNSKTNNQNNNGIKSFAPTSAPEGYTYVTVEIGINDTDYVEIVSGLEEGDVVVVPTEVTTTTTTNQQNFRGGMEGGGMPTGGGGMPPGGM